MPKMTDSRTRTSSHRNNDIRRFGNESSSSKNKRKGSPDRPDHCDHCDEFSVMNAITLMRRDRKS